MTTSNILAIAAAAAATAADQSVTTTGGGGEYTPPAKGVAMLRFVAYVEVGNQPQRPYQGKPKPDAPMVHLVFELHGKNYPIEVSESGEKIPKRITIKTRVSQNEKSLLPKLFRAMNYKGNATHFAQLLGSAYLGTVTHYVAPARGEPGAAGYRPEFTIAELVSRESGVSIRAPFITNSDPLTGETSTTDLESQVPPAVSSLKLFIWNHSPEHSQAMWDSLYIKTPDNFERSLNVFQDAIKAASNFPGSPIAEYLNAGGVPDLGEAGESVAEALGEPATGNDADMAALGLI